MMQNLLQSKLEEKLSDNYKYAIIVLYMLSTMSSAIPQATFFPLTS